MQLKEANFVDIQEHLSKIHIRPGHCSTLIYTSGTTGLPKAVWFHETGPFAANLHHAGRTWTYTS